MQDWIDPATGVQVQQVANANPMPWDKRPFFFIGWPTPGVKLDGVSGNTAAEAIAKAVERRPAERLAA